MTQANIQVSSYASEIFSYVVPSGTESKIYSTVEVYVNNINQPSEDYSFTIQNASSLKPKVHILICDLTDDSFKLTSDELEKKIKCADPDFFQIDFIVMEEKSKPVGKFGTMVLNRFVENRQFCVIVKSEDKDNIRTIVESIVYRPEFLNNSLFIHSIVFPRIHFFDLVFNLDDIKSQFITAVHFGIDESSEELPSYENNFPGNSIFRGPESIIDFRARAHWLVNSGIAEKTVLKDAENGKSPNWKNILKIPGNFPKQFVLVGNGFEEAQFFDDESDAFYNLDDLVSEYNQYLNPD